MWPQRIWVQWSSEDGEFELITPEESVWHVIYMFNFHIMENDKLLSENFHYQFHLPYPNYIELVDLIWQNCLRKLHRFGTWCHKTQLPASSRGNDGNNGGKKLRKIRPCPNPVCTLATTLQAQIVITSLSFMRCESLLLLRMALRWSGGRKVCQSCLKKRLVWDSSQSSGQSS